MNFQVFRNIVRLGKTGPSSKSGLRFWSNSEHIIIGGKSYADGLDKSGEVRGLSTLRDSLHTRAFQTQGYSVLCPGRQGRSAQAQNQNRGGLYAISQSLQTL